MIILSKEELTEIIAEGYANGYKKCMTDVIEHCNFVYEVIAEKARQDVLDAVGAIEIPEISAEEFDAVQDDMGGV